MNRILKSLLIVCMSFLLLNGCVSVTDTLYLQDAEVYGPITQPPVSFMNKDMDKKFSFSPKIYFNGTKQITGRVEGHSRVNNEGIFQLDTSFDESNNIRFLESRNANIYEYSGNNLTWHTPGYTLGFDAEFYVSPKFTVTTGLTVSEVKGKSLPGYKLGIGFGGFSGDFGLRFDAGLIWQEYAYEASSVIVRETSEWFGESSKEVFFFVDEGTSTNLNHYVSLNLHYADSDALFNPFISIAYSRQSILDFEPRDSAYPVLFGVKYDADDQRGGANVSYIVFTPGSTFYITDWIKLVASAKIFTGSDIQNVSHSSFIVPSLHLEFLF